MKSDDIRKTLLEVEEIKLKAQLRSVREAIKGEKQPEPNDEYKRTSQTEYVYQILKQEKKPLHISEIIKRCKDNYDIVLSRETIVSALLKKVNRFDRFIKTGPNTFGLSEYRELYSSQQDKE